MFEEYGHAQTMVCGHTCDIVTLVTLAPISAVSFSQIHNGTFKKNGERGSLEVNASDSGSRGQGFEPHSGKTVLCP